MFLHAVNEAESGDFVPSVSLAYFDVADLAKQIYFKNQTPSLGTPFPKHLSLATVLSLVIDSFTGATERHIEVCFFFFDPILFRRKPDCHRVVRLTAPGLVDFLVPHLCLSYTYGISLIRLETV